MAAPLATSNSRTLHPRARQAGAGAAVIALTLLAALWGPVGCEAGTTATRPEGLAFLCLGR